MPDLRRGVRQAKKANNNNNNNNNIDENAPILAPTPRRGTRRGKAQAQKAPAAGVGSGPVGPAYPYPMPRPAGRGRGTRATEDKNPELFGTGVGRAHLNLDVGVCNNNPLVVGKSAEKLAANDAEDEGSTSPLPERVF